MIKLLNKRTKILKKDFKYNHLLIDLFIKKILKCGKKRLAEKIIFNILKLIEIKTNHEPIFILEKAIRNISPRIKLKTQQIGGTTRQLPILLNIRQSIYIAIGWIINLSKKRSEKGIINKITNEILDATKGIGSAIRKKEEIHKMAKINKAYNLLD